VGKVARCGDEPVNTHGVNFFEGVKMFIVSLNYKCDIEEVEKYLDDHVSYLKQEYSNGNFIASGRKNPRTGGVILSCVKDRDELEVILKRDPFDRAGIAEYDITEFIPSMVAEGFEILQK
jgi:uncharacterized protein YciI